MPDVLNLDVSIPFSSSEMPPLTHSWNKAWISRYAYKRGYKWKSGEPKNQVLPYTGKVGRITLVRPGTPVSPTFGWYYEVGSFTAHHYYSGNALLNSPPHYGQQTWNRAYEKLRTIATGENASWGATIAEGREALGLVADRSMQLFRSYRFLRKGHFTSFLRELGIEPKRKHKRYTLEREGRRKSVVREVARKSSGLWLEYWFGWAPIAGEIYQSTIVLTAGQTYGKHWGTATMKCPPKTMGVGGGGSAKSVVESGRYTVKCGAEFKLVNLNQALTQQLGLANPLAIAWELVPFSFVADWFTNVGDVIGALSDYNGISISNPYTTEFLKTSGTYDTSYAGNTPSTWWKYKYNSYFHRRKASMIKPVLVRPQISNFGHSLTRAATAVSLLVSIFAKK